MSVALSFSREVEFFKGKRFQVNFDPSQGRVLMPDTALRVDPGEEVVIHEGGVATSFFVLAEEESDLGDETFYECRHVEPKVILDAVRTGETTQLLSDGRN